MNRIYELTKELSALLSVSGAEEKMAASVAEKMRPLCDSVTIDALGNVICEKESSVSDQTLLLCAHMDEVGFVVTGANDEGFVLLSPLGGKRPLSCAYARVRFENTKVGVLLPPADAKSDDLDLHSFVCDIGTKTKKDALKKVEIGMRGACVSEFVRLGGGRFCAKALDNKLGVATLIALAEALRDEKALPYRLVFLFSVQEEVGVRGATAAAFSIAPDYAINVDTTPACDVPGAKGSVKLGGGVCIKYKDRRTLCDRRIISHLEQIAKEHGIPTQPEILERGGTDTGAIQISRAGVIAGAVSLPIRNLHTTAETADLSDVKSAFELLLFAVKKTI